MKYYFKLSEDSDREDAYLRGDTPEPITLYEATPSIEWDAEHNTRSDWWGVYRFGANSTDWADFDSEEEALSEYYANFGADLYCKMNDC